MDLSPRPSLCVYVRKVCCGKTADWIRMLFVVVSGIRLGMCVLDGDGDCQTRRGSEFGASHCNQWAFAMRSSQITLRTCYS